MERATEPNDGHPGGRTSPDGCGDRPADRAARPARVDVDGAIHRLAARQDGVVARWQLQNVGVPVHAIDYRLKTGRLTGVFRGVYRCGPVVGPRARAFAAVLASGTGAVASHATAAREWGMLRPGARGGGGRVHVTIPGGYRRPDAGVRVHRSRCLARGEVTRLGGLPITTAGRTLLDLAGTASPGTVEQALARATRRGLVSSTRLASLLGRHPRRAGAARLRSFLEAESGPAFVRSEAESRFLGLVRDAGLRQPECNAMVEGYEADFVWRDRRLIVEVDGYAYHRSTTAFERDRERDAELVAAGYRVMRVTWRRLAAEPAAIRGQLGRVLESS